MFLFSLLFRVLDANYTEGNFIYLSQVLHLILAETYFREKKDATSIQNKMVTKIIRYMYAHLTKPLTLAKSPALSDCPRAISTYCFNSIQAGRPMDFFINLKMKHACRVLRSTSYPVCEIAKQLGYNDPYYFSRIFKKTIGIAPKLYRQSDLNATRRTYKTNLWGIRLHPSPYLQAVYPLGFASDESVRSHISDDAPKQRPGFGIRLIGKQTKTAEHQLSVAYPHLDQQSSLRKRA